MCRFSDTCATVIARTIAFMVFAALLVFFVFALIDFDTNHTQYVLLTWLMVLSAVGAGVSGLSLLYVASKDTKQRRYKHQPLLDVSSD
jgi:prepilin signal peptidase PulO-like enzyme (type II secretory pathway)